MKCEGGKVVDISKVLDVEIVELNEDTSLLISCSGCPDEQQLQ